MPLNVTHKTSRANFFSHLALEHMEFPRPANFLTVCKVFGQQKWQKILAAPTTEHDAKAAYTPAYKALPNIQLRVCVPLWACGTLVGFREHTQDWDYRRRFHVVNPPSACTPTECLCHSNRHVSIREHSLIAWSKTRHAPWVAASVETRDSCL